jgi:hypothetical protein
MVRPRSPATTSSSRYLISSVVKLIGIECYRHHGSDLAARTGEGEGGEHSGPLSNNWGALSVLNFFSNSDSRVRKSLSILLAR